MSTTAVPPAPLALADSTPIVVSRGVKTNLGSDVRIRRQKRRFSGPSSTASIQPLKICKSLSYSLEALDLSSASPIQTLASLRFLVLSYLADLESRLSDLKSPSFEAWNIHDKLTVDEAAQWARTALEMLEGIRADVCSHLPELQFADLSSLESFVKAHLPDLPDVPKFTEMRSHLPDMPHLPDMAEMRSHLPEMPQLPHMDNVRSHLSDMRLKLDDVRTRFHEFDFQKPLGYIPTLSNHLKNLHTHLSSMELPSGLPVSSLTSSTVLSDLLDALLSSEIVTDILNSTPAVVEADALLERTACEVTDAIKRSFNGVRLINYSDLPAPWRSNPFVTDGYRFIPVERWPLIVLSLFAFHNETLNIHTHLLPFLLWGINLIPLSNNTPISDIPELLFMAFALLCLLSSTLWHTMAGCAHKDSMEFCARVDYVGIGWLISASIGTIVYYGFSCHPSIRNVFLGLSFATGLAGNIFPFMSWFNLPEYRLYRIYFFLTLAFSAIGPMIALSILHSSKEMFSFIAPVIPSLLSYVIGLIFYVTQFPECILSANVRRRLDSIGGGKWWFSHYLALLHRPRC
ncbi:hypothetical protein BYT27DRAFT_7180754 [Phlegmacium glaucopus]|nr:hypothetical protein BYT27DRAFT_7180754 [Phlegmacium glaucopus]